MSLAIEEGLRKEERRNKPTKEKRTRERAGTLESKRFLFKVIYCVSTFNIFIIMMFRQNRSKTEGIQDKLELGERSSWSLIGRSKSTPKNRGDGDTEFKLPKLKKIQLSQKQKQFVNLRVIQMKRMGYDPIGCSKSIKL